MDFMKNMAMVLCLLFLVGCLKFSVNKNDLKAFDVQNIEFDRDTYPVAILGGGIGGLTASVYLAQANIDTLVLQGNQPGGALTMSESVRNWPGELDISGRQLSEKIQKQAKLSGAKIESQEVDSVDFNVWPYLIKTKEGKNIKALTCIIAMGARPNLLGVEGEKEYFGKGVSTCAICDGPLYKDKTVVIVGGGNAAVTEASYLSNIAKQVFVLVRRDSLRAKGKFVDEVLAKPNVKVFYSTQVNKILGDGKKVTGLELGDKALDADGLFLAIGSKPNTKMFRDQLELNSQDYIVLNNGQETSKRGVYAVGDISDSKYKQAILASGAGCNAALQAQSFLDQIGFSKQLFDKSSEKETERKLIKSHVVEVRDKKEFDKIIHNSRLPVIVDFYANWCLPCQKMVPVFEHLARDYKGKIKFVKINVSSNADVAGYMNIFSVPTFAFLKSGKELDRIQGATDYNHFKNLIDKVFLIRS